MIETKSSVLAVIGDPVEHSLSPLMQNWMIQKFGLEAIYLAFFVRESELEAAVAGMRALNIRGLNVTVPHKTNVLRYVDTQSDQVQKLGAANTLALKDGRILAYVTDPFGFLQSLGANQDRFKGADVFLVGAGGGARSVCYALTELGIGKLIVTDQDEERAKNLAVLAVEQFGLQDVEYCPAQPEKKNAAISASSVVINATPAGMSPHIDQSPVNDFAAFTKKHFVYDLIYNPAKTKFLLGAEKQGATIQNGLDMLIFQGLGSLKIWYEADLQLDTPLLAELQQLMKQKLEIHG
ncbi:shikimate dehydrogenase [candidate division KSB1 bacterium]|nr:shikimate dehydrogenase [candidate division KSB1 bacterium]